MNYKNLLKWIKTNPEIRTQKEFCKGVQSEALFSYYVSRNLPLPIAIIIKYKTKYSLNEAQVKKFFYFVG